MENYSTEGLRSGHTPTTVEEAVRALVSAIILAGAAALGSAYTTKYRGHEADFDFAEASATIAVATATAAYAAADTEDGKPILRRRVDSLTIAADTTAVSAEAAYAAARARGTTMSSSSSSLTSIGGLFAWPFRSSPPPSPKSTLESAFPHCSMDNLVTSITAAAITSAAAAHSAVEAAMTTNKTTTVTKTGLQRPYDVEDAARLYVASRLAQASASAASAAASAVRATHPALSVRAARAAGAAVAASSSATTTRLTLLAALSQMQDRPSLDYSGQDMRGWLAKLESFGSKTARVEFRACAAALSTFWEPQAAALAAASTLLSIEEKLKCGEVMVATAGSAYAPNISDESSSITIGAFTPGADDEDINNSNNDI